MDHRNPYWIPHESRVTLPRKRMLMSFYHPIRNLRNPINFDVTSGFLSMSDMFNDARIFVILIFPFWFWACFVEHHLIGVYIVFPYY
jgi:hypothetical protein